MNWEAIGAIGEILGAVAVVATLGYLAIQIRQNTASSQAATELEATKILGAWLSRGGVDDDLPRLWDEVATADEDQLPSGDYRRYMFWVAELFHLAEGVFVQFQRGFLSKETWEEWERIMAGFLQTPPVKDWWTKRKAPFSDDFYEYMESVRCGEPTWTQPPIDHRNRVSD